MAATNPELKVLKQDIQTLKEMIPKQIIRCNCGFLCILWEYCKYCGNVASEPCFSGGSYEHIWRLMSSKLEKVMP